MSAQVMVNEEYEPSEGEREVVNVLKEGRANPYYIREQTGIDKQNINTYLNKLIAAGWVRKITTGLYELVEDPRNEK